MGFERTHITVTGAVTVDTNPNAGTEIRYTPAPKPVVEVADKDANSAIAPATGMAKEDNKGAR